MTALANDKIRPVRLEHGELTTAELMMAGIAEIIYKGSLVICDESANDGYFRALASGTADAADIFGGVAAERQENTVALGDGGAVVTVFRNGVWGFPVGNVAQTDIGAPAYATDDATVVTTSTNNQWIGYFVGVDAVYCWVDITGAYMRANSAT